MEEVYKAGGYRVVVKENEGRWKATVYKLGVKQKHADTKVLTSKEAVLLEASLICGVPFADWERLPGNGKGD